MTNNNNISVEIPKTYTVSFKGDEEATLIGMGTTGAIGGTTGLSAHAKKGCPLPLTFCKK